MSEQQPQTPKAEDPQAQAAKKILELMMLDPSTSIKKGLEVWQQYSPMPSVDFLEFYKGQERNRDVMMKAMKRANQMLEGVAVRQQEYVANSIKEANTAMAELSSAGSPPAAIAKQTEYVKQTLVKAMKESQELYNYIVEAQTNIIGLLANRTEDFMDEIQAPPRPKTKGQ